MIRRYGETPKTGRRYTRRPGVYAILPSSAGLLLTFQQAPIPEVQLPGGGVDPGEHPVRALHREVMEETGWSIAAPRRLGVFRRFTYMPDYDLWAEKVCSVYVARPIRQIGPASEPGHTALWLDPARAVGMLETKGEKAFLAGWLDGAGVR